MRRLTSWPLLFCRKALAAHREQGGFILGGLGLLVVLALGGIMITGFIASINWMYLIAVMAMVIIVVAMVGAVKYKMPFQFVILISMISMAVVVFIGVGVLAAAGLMVLGVVLFKFSPSKQPAIFVGLVAVGLLTVIWGTKFILIPMGLIP